MLSCIFNNLPQVIFIIWMYVKLARIKIISYVTGKEDVLVKDISRHSAGSLGFILPLEACNSARSRLYKRGDGSCLSHLHKAIQLRWGGSEVWVLSSNAKCLCCPLETITALLIVYSQYKINSVKKKCPKLTTTVEFIKSILNSGFVCENILFLLQWEFIT